MSPRGAWTRAALVPVALLAAACSDASLPAPRAEPRRGTGEPHAAGAAPRATDPAIAIFERRVAEDPRDSGSLAVLAHLRIRAFELHGDPADLGRAETAARGALAADPANAQAASLLVRALSAQHRDAEAFGAYDAFCAAHGGGAYVSQAAACAAFDAGLWSRAETEAGLFRSGAADPVVLLVRARLAELRGDAGADDAARKARRAATADGMLPHEVAACGTAAGEMAFRAGRLRDAARDFEDAIASCPGYAPALGGLADVAAAEGRSADAARFVAEALQRRATPTELARAARIAAAAGDRDGAASAERALRAACEAHPAMYAADAADAAVRARGVTWRDADLPEALARIDTATTARPLPENHAIRARVLLALGRADEAAAAVASARRMGTRTPSILETAARVALALGDRKAAAREVAALRAIHPSFVPADLAKELPE